MITIQYYATEREDLVSHLSHDDKNPISIKPLQEIEDKIKKSTPIFNFASFFGKGIDLYDESIELGGADDYYGFIPQKTQADQKVAVSFGRITGEEAPQLDNGITVEFNNYTCKKITVERNGSVLGTAEAEEGFLPEKVHIAFTTPEDSWLEVTIIFSGFPEDAPINLKGVILGRIVAVDDVMSFDMIAETNPISDDLAMNETNITAVIDEDFTGYEGQKIILHDNGEVLENGVLKSAEETEIDLYNLKLRNRVSIADEIEYEYAQLHYNEPASIEYDWNNFKITPDKVVSEISEHIGLSIEIPDSIKDTRLSAFLPKCKSRKVLQQVAWACCCGIDTTYSDKIRLVPYFAPEEDKEVSPDIVITNNDDRILKTSVKEGGKYSKIVWKTTRYFRSNEEVDLGEVELRYISDHDRFIGKVRKDEPFIVSSHHGDDNYTTYWSETPYYAFVEYKTEDVYDNINPFNSKLSAHKYDKYEHTLEISTGANRGAVLEISNQIIFPLEEQMTENKIAQLKKWYSNNNTLSATIVDNDSQIRLGKVIKVELKKPGTFFQGIVTKIVRNNVGTYHTVELEAHQWD